jgi:hypothetical protein
VKGKEVLAILRGKGVTSLYHVNTVATSCSFISAGALLSRAAVEQSGSIQTPQPSDQLDKSFGIWNDIFLDGVDVHLRAGDRNHYGPVCFELSIDSVLGSGEMQDAVLVTRDNPIRWNKNQSEQQRYFITAEELTADYAYGDFSRHITLRLSNGRLPLRGHVLRIFLDDPKRELDGQPLFDLAKTQLAKAAKDSWLIDKIQPHPCRYSCRCTASYAKYSAAELRLKFTA